MCTQSPWWAASLPVRERLGPPEWVSEAACRGGLQADVADALFFPGRGHSGERARTICATCPVRAECLQHALEVGEKFGIWGGTSEKERRELKRQAS